MTTVIYPKDSENFRLWLEDLRTTSEQQTTGFLASYVDGTHAGEMAYCCLGRGCRVAEAHGAGLYWHYHDGVPPVEFLVWLGVPRQEVEGVLGEGTKLADVSVDWPMDPAYLQRQEDSYEEFRDDPDSPAHAADPWSCDFMLWSCAELNDECKLTFAQIADVAAYFGIRV